MSTFFLFDRLQICACEVTILCEKMNYIKDYLTIGHYYIFCQLSEKYIRDKIKCFESFIDVLLSLSLWTGFCDGLTCIRSVLASGY